MITIGKTYNIFISHAWKYNEHYYRLENMLKNAPNFLWRNYSVPKHDPKIDPNTPVGKRTLKKELEKQVKPSSCVIVIAGMYSHYREWIQEEIKKLEDEIKNTQYNKATQKHIGILKAKLAKLRDLQNKPKSGGSGYSYAVKKTGDATVAFVGFPSVGKSTLLNKITNANSEVGAYAFTTLTIIPGLLEYRGDRKSVV